MDLIECARLALCEQRHWHGTAAQTRASYRTLLSRAQRGTVIYATGRETRDQAVDLMQLAPR